VPAGRVRAGSCGSALALRLHVAGDRGLAVLRQLRACFRQNKAKLSQNCQAAITSYMKAQRKG
jgi:hypothetical protein